MSQAEAATSSTRSRWWNAALDLIYPPVCASCGRIDSALCTWCFDQTLRFDGDQQPFVSAHAPPLHHVASTGLHSESLRNLVLTLKVSPPSRLVDALAARLAVTLTQLNWPVSLIVPVPLHPSRLLERGYNQSAQLARSLGQMMLLPVAQDGLKRLRNTPHQVGLTGEQRATNVANAFQGDPGQLAQHAVLLIDDVFTTGATLRACAEAALEAGAASIFGLTVTAAGSS